MILYTFSGRTHRHSLSCFSSMCFSFLNLFFPILFFAFMGVFLLLPCFFSNLLPSFFSAFDAFISSAFFPAGFLTFAPCTVSPSSLATFAFFGPAGESFLPFGCTCPVFLAAVPLPWIFSFKPPALPGTVFFILSLLDGFSSEESGTTVASEPSAFSSSK